MIDYYMNDTEMKQTSGINREELKSLHNYATMGKFLNISEP